MQSFLIYIPRHLCINIPHHLCSIILKFLSINLPSHWHPMPHATRSMLVEITSSSHYHEWNDVQSHFMTTSTPLLLTIIKIERVQNAVIYQRYNKKKNELLASDPSHPVDLPAYHGCRTSPVHNPVASIVDTGFELRYSKNNNPRSIE